MSRLDRCHDLEDMRREARRHLPRAIFEFMDRGAERELALAENLAAFQRLKLRSRFLVGLSQRDMGTEIFGRRIAMPLAIAPTGAAGLLWYQGELALARAAAAAGVPFTLAGTSITPMEAVRAAGGRLWFQVYMWKEQDLTFEMIERARGLGYEALFVTVDTALGRTREYNDRNGFTDPISLNRRFVTDMVLHPRWLVGVIGRYLAGSGMPRHANYPAKYQVKITRGLPGEAPQNSATMTWADIGRIRAVWPGPLVVKGISTGDDARRAVDQGADGVVVSNHGGRALDSAAASIDMLPEVVRAVGDRTTVLLDSGVRQGSDVLKALARGARAVLIGRATLYGIATAGEAGAAKVLRLLATQFEKNMGYVGCRKVAEVGPEIFVDRREMAGRDAACHERQP
jgi:isopentenyl diphosphate isomerase/L-lactate dehydrogenase-like FMN-dependent dehydrogenase